MCGEIRSAESVMVRVDKDIQSNGRLPHDSYTSKMLVPLPVEGSSVIEGLGTLEISSLLSMETDGV